MVSLSVLYVDAAGRFARVRASRKNQILDPAEFAVLVEKAAGALLGKRATVVGVGVIGQDDELDLGCEPAHLVDDAKSAAVAKMDVQRNDIGPQGEDSFDGRIRADGFADDGDFTAFGEQCDQPLADCRGIFGDERPDSGAACLCVECDFHGLNYGNTPPKPPSASAESRCRRMLNRFVGGVLHRMRIPRGRLP